MLLMPPRSAPDSRPLYHISVSINPFIPTSSTTTIRRGASENGEHVADFEYVIMHASIYLKSINLTKMSADGD
jgi:hypothetical protein